MTAEQQTALRDELKNDPAARGYAVHLPDDPVRAVELITEQITTMTGPLRSTTAKAWAAAGPMAKIEDACLDASHPCRASCLVIRQSFACGDLIHLEDSRLQTMLAGWVTAGVATQAAVDELYQLAQVAASRADVIGIPSPSARDVLDAWGS